MVALPTRREHKWTGLTEPIGRYVYVKMTDADGRVGWGEAPVLKDWGGEFGRYFGETPGTTTHVIDTYLAPAILGAEPGNFVELHQRMDRAIKGYPYAKAAVDFAAYDLAARALAVPVHDASGRAVAALNSSSHSRHTSSAEMVAKRLPTLQRIAKAISEELASVPVLSLSAQV